jgi:hypothetical protein
MSTYIVITLGGIIGGAFGSAIYFPRRRRVSPIETTDNPTERQARQFFLSLV